MIPATRLLTQVSVFDNSVAGIVPGLAATPQRLLDLTTEDCEPIAFIFLTFLELRQWEIRQRSPGAPREPQGALPEHGSYALVPAHLRRQKRGLKLFRYL